MTWATPKSPSGGGGSSLTYALGVGMAQLATNNAARQAASWTPPPLSAYEDWIAGRHRAARASNAVPAVKYRRLAILVRQVGDSPNAAGKKINLNNGAAAYAKLPDHLK